MIEIQTLAQLHAIRTDLDGDGRTDAGLVADPNLLGNTGCLDNACKGYELGQTLNFDENGDGNLNDTYNRDDGAWEWIFFEGTDTFTCTIKQSSGTPTTAWSFMNACNSDVLLSYGFSTQESFSECNDLFMGRYTADNDPLYSSEVSIDRSKLPLSFFISPSTPRISCSHLGTTIFSHDFLIFLISLCFLIFQRLAKIRLILP